MQQTFGIGGDGLILLENDPESDFKMVYYNQMEAKVPCAVTEEDVWWLRKKTKSDWTGLRLML
jgi:hypothetical protein